MADDGLVKLFYVDIIFEKTNRLLRFAYRLYVYGSSISQKSIFILFISSLSLNVLFIVALISLSPCPEVNVARLSDAAVFKSIC